MTGRFRRTALPTRYFAFAPAVRLTGTAPEAANLRVSRGRCNQSLRGFAGSSPLSWAPWPHDTTARGGIAAGNQKSLYCSNKFSSRTIKEQNARLIKMPTTTL
jgi:hypothetical protein